MLDHTRSVWLVLGCLSTLVAVDRISNPRNLKIKNVVGLCGRGRGWDDLGEWH